MCFVCRYIEESLPQHCSGLWAVINNAGMTDSRYEHRHRTIKWPDKSSYDHQPMFAILCAVLIVINTS